MSSNVFTILNAVPALLGGAAPQPDTPSNAMLLAAAVPGTAVLHRGYNFSSCLILLRLMPLLNYNTIYTKLKKKRLLFFALNSDIIMVLQVAGQGGGVG